MKTIKLPTDTFRYDPNKPLGKRGGFGQVFFGLASDGREVAVKKLHVLAADAAHRELSIAREFKGRTFEHVMPFIDSGEDADTGEYFLVMPRADGSLQEAMERDGGLPPSSAASVLLEMIQGLSEVGEIVHRDLKPDNILYHEGLWKIADFGIARFVEEATASNTLKDCLSPFYAAPEQWRFERATHATDVYALGCIGFFIMTGRPPFVTRPELEHLKEPFPQFDCADGRLRALINNMVRKLPETRPTLSRIQGVLTEVVAKPYVGGADSLSALAAAGAIHAEVPNAHRRPGRSGDVFECKLGDGSLAVNLSRSSNVEPDSFPQSGWDVIASSQIIVTQEKPQYQWSASLWYVKLRGASEYRWNEVSYWSMSTRGPQFQPFASSGQDADYAASNIMHTVSIAFGPEPIDDEKEDEFHGRWIWLFAKASSGQLRHPSSLPIHGWPPQL